MNLSAITDQRVSILNQLAMVFHEAPSIVQLQQLAATIFPLADSLKEQVPVLHEGYQQLYATLRQYSPDEADQNSLELQRDYTRLFCVGLETIGTTASVILSPQRLQKREPWQKVRQFYLQHGWQPKTKASVLEDSVSMELSFYALLVEDGDEAQNDFLQDHLSTWLYAFCSQLQNAAGVNSVYYGIANLLHGYLKVETLLLGEDEAQVA